jgi:hypothetical protein
MAFKRKPQSINFCDSNINKGLSFDGVSLAVAYANPHVFTPFNRGVKMEKPSKLTKDMTAEEAIEGIFTKEVCDDLMKAKQTEHINHS